MAHGRSQPGFPGLGPGGGNGLYWWVACFVASAVLLADSGWAVGLDGAPDASCAAGDVVAGEIVNLELVSGGLSRPVGVTAPPGDAERVFVVEQTGRIRVLDRDTGAQRGTPFLNLSTTINSGNGESGLLGLAFHPDYETNGYFFVNYTRASGDVCAAGGPPGCVRSKSAETVVARFQRSEADPDRADPDSMKVLLSFCQPFSNHNAGDLAFGPFDGYLYVTTGDGGSGGDPCDSGQDPRSFLGKLLRIDVDTDDDTAYAIPTDNPFVGEDKDPGDLVLDEVWALGLRNPWRLGFDSVTGDLYIGDVGQNRVEEIDFQTGSSLGGENYQWRVREGNSPHGSAPLTFGVSTAPVLDYAHSGGDFQGCSVTGGVVYRGCRMPDLQGTYFFADFCTDWVRSFRMDGDAVTDLQDRTKDLRVGLGSLRATSISSFGVDGLGEIYVCDHAGGEVFRMVPGHSNGVPNPRLTTTPESLEVRLERGFVDIELDGSASDNGDGSTDDLTYRWRKESGPSGDSLSSRTASVVEVRLVTPGEYVYSLRVDDGLDSASVEVTIVVVAPSFQRGDANSDGVYNVSDPGAVVFYLFLDGFPEEACRDAMDANDDSLLDLADVIYMLSHQFLGRTAPPPPYPDCGNDPTAGDLIDCDAEVCVP